MKSIEEIYLNILFEDNYSTDYWEKYTSYKNIDFYIRKDGHLQLRLKERYSEVPHSLIKVLNIVKKFIKEEMKLENSIFKKNIDNFSFLISGELSKINVAGRFKANKDLWRCYLSTVLPYENMHHTSNDYFKIVKA